jgi:hypothetical protein
MKYMTLFSIFSIYYDITTFKFLPSSFSLNSTNSLKMLQHIFQMVFVLNHFHYLTGLHTPNNSVLIRRKQFWPWM